MRVEFERFRLGHVQQWMSRTLILAVMLVAGSADGAEDIRRDATVAAVERVLPGVVNISTRTVAQRRGFIFDWFRDNWAPLYQERPRQFSAGSGVIIDEEGYIITNVHVVEEASEIEVTLADKRTFPAELLMGTRRSDVALLKIKAKPGERFTPVKFGADDDLLLGETVIALGNPFGLGVSVSRGILSAKTRRPKAEGVLEVEDWIQTDAAINPGNSGGPLVNLKGEMIGLNVAVFREGQGIGFAIPVKQLSASLAEIFTPELIRSMWFGAILNGSTNGVTVAEVQAGSPAENAGMKKGDVILQVNKVVPPTVFATYRELINQADQKISLTLQRGTTKRVATVQMVPEKEYFNEALLKKRLGLSIKPLTPQVAMNMGLIMNGGLVVTEIEEESPADKAGFQRGIILESLDGRGALDVTAAAKILAAKKAGEKVRVGVILGRPLRRAEVDLAVR